MKGGQFSSLGRSKRDEGKAEIRLEWWTDKLATQFLNICTVYVKNKLSSFQDDLLPCCWFDPSLPAWLFLSADSPSPLSPPP